MTNEQRLDAVCNGAAHMIGALEAMLAAEAEFDATGSADACAASERMARLADWHAGHALRVGSALPGAGRAA